MWKNVKESVVDYSDSQSYVAAMKRCDERKNFVCCHQAASRLTTPPFSLRPLGPIVDEFDVIFFWPKERVPSLTGSSPTDGDQTPILKIAAGLIGLLPYVR